MGISIGAGQGSADISMFGSVYGIKGKENGNGTRWTETTLDSGGRLSLTSGRDTTLDGAQVIANAGRDLTLTSQQDSDRYDSKQTSYGAGGRTGGRHGGQQQCCGDERRDYWEECG
ncbi:hypothetical protein F3I52_13040 [Pantoea sp. M_8]|uniref:Uncharacterized protein n=1 Tax=Pantoea anthophila TaxID=470931 RepID=A0ABY2ZH96_9GAMM|nr:hypothetical protein F3I51_13740 [Pantoea sp. M_6]KAA5976435.1 hypothetical protein F3I52_13040 [Pantoea sp. M_8]KAA5987721.1 hypothetical protein F3I47_18980 [Pantoea sp. M_10]TPV33548.1 hypothetical protein FJW00_01365 [Pantoea anthophila]